MSDREKPTLLVTGASRGIGAAIARKAGLSGWRVMINYFRGKEQAEAVAAEIRAGGGEVELVSGDAGSEEGIAAIFASVDAKFGHLDGFVNNAGIVDQPSRVADMSRERLERMFAVNTIGAIRCAGEAVRRMSVAHGHKGGSIVNLSSMAAVIGSAGQYVDYAASKAAIDTLTVGLSKEVAGEGIRVNAIRPGVIDTDLHASGGIPDRAKAMASQIPLGRPGHADEIADAALFLLSEQASYITGAILNVSGGR